MNSGFRNLLVRRDTTRFKAYFLAIALQMLMLPFLDLLGVVKLSTPAFYPLGATLGGFLFGLAMNWGGGCAGGVWYKLGSGSIGAFVVIIGLITGYITMENGALKSLRLFIQSIGRRESTEAMTLTNVLNLSLSWLAVPLALALLVFLLKRPPFNSEKGWSWRTTGLVVGAIGIIAWVASSLSGRFFGMAIMQGSKDAFDALTSGGNSSLSWDLFFVLGIPIGGYLSASRQGQFHWSNISGAAIWKLVGGGFVLGASASLAGGCTVGHGLTGIPLLSIGSIAFTVFAILGAWAGVYLSKNS